MDSELIKLVKVVLSLNGVKLLVYDEDTHTTKHVVSMSVKDDAILLHTESIRH